MVTIDNQDETTELPTGTLSFLFTDVVDSTALWETAPDLMDGALARHDEIIDDAIAAHGGLVLKHKGEGDSTFCVFREPSDAASAALDAQRTLRAEGWDPRAPIRVRMGIHTGDAILRGRDYYGQTINRAARVRAVAVGGQILLSGTTTFALGNQLPADSDLRFHGRQQLKGIIKAEEIHELVDLLTRSEDDVVESPDEQRPPLPPAIEAAIPRAVGGRTEALARIDRLRTQQRETTSHLVLIRGEPGGGKTTLAAVASRDAFQDGATVLHGVCDEHLETPFEPFLDIFGQYVEHAPRHILVEHIAAHGGEIGRLTPKLRARVGDLPPVEALDPETTRKLLMEAATDLLLRAAADNPVVIVIEDLHWADPNTALLMERLSTSGGALVIVGTARLTVTETMSAHVDRLLTLPTTTDIVLEGFAEEEILGLLEALAGTTALQEAGKIAAFLREQTDGNPLFLVEVLRHFVETGVLSQDPATGWFVKFDAANASPPSSVRAVVQERVNRLGPEISRILTLASVAGREFDPALLAHVLGEDEALVLDGIEAAVEASLVREVGVGEFAFAHALVQGTLYDQISSTRRALHHRQLAAGIEELYGDAARPALVASHWARAGSAGRAHIGPWAMRAGQAAMRELAPEEAIRWFQATLDVTEDDAERLPVLLELGNAQRWVSSESFRQTFLDAAALATRLDDRDALVRSALDNNRGGASAAGQIDHERIAVIERALGVVGPDDGADRARLLATLAIELSQGADWEATSQAAGAATACARRLGDETTLMRVLLLTTEATRVPHTLDQRQADSEGMLDIARRVGDPVLLGIAALREVRVRVEAAQFDAAAEALALLDDVARYDPYLMQNRAALAATLRQVEGDLDGAARLIQEALDAAAAWDDRTAIYATQQAQLLWDRGGLEEMIPMMEAALESYAGIRGFRAILGLAYVSAGRRDDASTILDEEVANEFADSPLNPIWLATMSLFASLAIELDHVPAATLLDARLRPWRGRANSSVVSINGLVTESLAGLAVVRGDFEQAEIDVRDALDQAESLGACVSATRSHLTAARLFHRRGADGDGERAMSEARAAAEDAERIGMRDVLTASRNLMAEIV